MCVILEVTSLEHVVGFRDGISFACMLGMAELEAGKCGDSNKKNSNAKKDVCD